MSQNTGLQNYGFDQDWSAPIRISGSNGEDGNHGTNGAGQFSGNMVGSTYNHLQATAVVRALAQRDPVIGDVVTLSEVNNRTNSVTKICNAVTELGNGEFNDTVVLHIDGSLLVDGTIVGSKILAGTIDSTHISVGSLNADKITANTLDVGGKAITGSIGMIGGTAGNDVTMPNHYEISEVNFVNAAPQHIAAANHADSSVTAGDVMGGLPLFQHTFTTGDFVGTRQFSITANLNPVGLFNNEIGPSSAFAMAVKATTNSSDYSSTTASNYVTTRGLSRAYSMSAFPYTLADIVSLIGNTQYYVWVFGVLDDTGLTSGSSHIAGLRGINNGQITILGLNA